MKTINYVDMYNHLEKIPAKFSEDYLLSIVIPVYNEDDTIKQVLSSLPRGERIEIIVVDDCSVDNSVKEIEELKKKLRIRLIRHKRNYGYGRAILTGIKNSRGRIIVTMDSDGQHRPEDIYTLVKPILDDEAELTIGSRYVGKYYYDLSIFTRLGEALIEKAISLLFGQTIRNNQNGFRAFKREIIHIFDNIHYQGYAFATEILLKTAVYDYRIQECPIHLFDREYGSSNIVLNRLALNIFACILRYFLKKMRMRLFPGHKKP